MKLKCLACDVLARPLYHSAAHSPHIVDIELFPRGLHNTPAILRGRLQAQIDGAAGQGYDAVVMAYGLCGQATAGLTARDAPVVVPRAHDCITIFLGSRERYDAQFQQQPGTYWYALDYIERDDNTGGSMGLGAGTGTEGQAVYEEYVAKYGQDNADYLMEVMGQWQAHYKRAAFIDMGVGDGSRVESMARQDAARRGWIFEKVAGDMVLVRRLLFGDWDRDFLVLEPGQSLTMTHDDQVIGCSITPAVATASSLSSPTIISSDASDWTEHPRFVDIGMKSLVSSADNPQAGVNLVRVPPGGIIGRHLHANEIETVYVLAGQSMLTLGDADHPFAAGQIVAIPAGLEHALSNTGSETVELLCIFTPPLA